MTSKNRKGQNKFVIEYEHSKARKFFLKSECYQDFDLPPYFKFGTLIEQIDKYLIDNANALSYKKAKSIDKVNYTILNNKDGQYAWRRLQLIHPVLYVSLVHKITEKNNWSHIKERFSKFRKNEKISCVSLPIESLNTDKTDKDAQINLWWLTVEQESIKLALKYECLIKTDITDCYGSIYSHSIAWALHEKDEAKKNRNNSDLIGNIIDWHLQGMSHGQTNGIPQGSILMDFIAEMVLGYADLKLSEKIHGSGIKDYHIIRYRDDYRIFVNNPQDGKKIVRYLSEILCDLGLKINANKTEHYDEVIKNAIKSDKLYWVLQNRSSNNLQEQLLIIYELASQHHSIATLAA